MQFEDDTDFTTLGWVKPQIDETLLQARHALEAYAEESADASQMRDCANWLHQVQGTLRMVELYGASMLAEEMEALAQALLDGKVPQREEAYTVLMRGLVQLPDYLEHVQAGQKDIPIVLLPLINELRAAHGGTPAAESTLFAPHLEHKLPEDAPGARIALPAGDLRQRVGAIRSRFQATFATWLRGHSADVGGMRTALSQLGAVCHELGARRLWWIADGVLDSLQQGRLDARAQDAVQQQFTRVDRAIKTLQDEGEAALDDDEARDLARSLLYLLGQAKPGGARADAVRKTYSLDALLPTEAELEHARGSISGRNRALLNTVAQALKEDLLHVKEALDIFLRRDDYGVSELSTHVDTLRRVGDTLGMLGLAAPRRVVSEQREILQAVAEGIRPPEEETLMDVAGALLFVDASLDDHIERLGGPSPGAGPEPAAALPRSEARKVVDALMREAAVNLARIKDDIVAFIESPWAHDRVVAVPRLVDEVGGALRMLGLQRPADLLLGVGRFVENELVVEQCIPTAEQMDTLADAMAGIEYYLESARGSRGGERILDGTQRSLEKLGYWPVPLARTAPETAERPAPAAVTLAVPDLDLSDAVSIAAGSGVEDLIVGASETPAPAEHELSGLRLAETAPMAPPEQQDGEWVEVEEEVDEPVTGELAADFQDAAGIDEDIREVFVEEVGEEIASIREHLPAWKANPEDLDALKSVRRSFHTLKGSGRLVGALALGEFSWKVENMLNRVLDRSILPDANAQALVDHALAALPELHAALQGEGAPRVALSAIMRAADKLAAGEPARVEDFMQVHKVRRMVRRWVPRAAELEAVPKAALAQVSALPPVDPMLLEILRVEVAQHLSTMRDYIKQASAPPVDDAMVRAAHTLHGAVAMVDIPVLTSVLTPLESWFKRMRAERAAPDAQGIAALRDAVAFTDHVIAQFDSPQPEIPDATALAERLSALRDALPEASMADVLRGEELPERETGATESASIAHLVEADALAPADVEAETASRQEQAEAERIAQEQRLDAERVEAERLAAERAEAERREHERLEAERAAEEQRVAEEERLAAERAEAERVEVERREQERLVAEQAALEAERAAERAEAERLESERQEQAKVEAERIAQAQRVAEEERLAAERAEAERIEAESREQERLAAERAEAGRIEAERVEAERLEAERAEAERIEAERAEAERIEAERQEQARIAAEQAEADRRATEAAAIEAERRAELERAAQQAAQKLAEERRQAAQARQRSLAALPPFPDDPQPEGKLELVDADPDLLEIFTQEGAELLDHSDGLLTALRDAPEQREPIAGLQRDLHTLKGGARVAGIAPIGDLAHAMETLLEGIADGRREIDPLVVESLERGFDRLHQLLQRVIHGHAIAMPANAIARFEQLARGKVEPAADEAAAATAPGKAKKDKIAPREAPAFEEESRAPQEMIRVRSDLLDSLVNYAGEVSIYRSRLEQQVSSFRFNLVELDQTVARLRAQLRSLEIETEAQILSRYQREHEGAHDATFDPLELDRFSQLQQYSRALAESVSDLSSIQDILDDQTRQSETLLLQQSRVSSDLQEGLMRTRMVPFESMVPSLRRTLRQAAMDLGKRAQLRVEGAQGEMDRNLLERMKAPFEHMLRNALAHGIEAPDARIENGKPEEGTVSIHVSREATEVLIRVSDDGAGFDRTAIRAKAIERGLLNPDVQLSDRDLYAFVLETGFSTAESVTQVAGRGVGMDVVANEIKQLGGTLSIESEYGRGSRFNIRLPFTLAVAQAILVRTGDTVYAVPMTSIQGVARIKRDELDKRIASGNPVFTYAGEDYAIHDLSQLLGIPSGQAGEDPQLPLLMIRTGDLRAAVRIDMVVGSREIVVKSVGPQVSSVPGIFGATIMGDGSVMLILDIAPLVRRAVARQETTPEAAEAARPAAPEATAQLEDRPQPLIMVVDDSITMRKVTGRVLERNEYEVMTAKDGMDALEKLMDRVPDLMLLDIEMPRMDGYELATHMKNDPRLREVPIIMITSRTGEKHRQRAFEIGVDRYLGKPYNEAELLRNVQEILEGAHV